MFLMRFDLRRSDDRTTTTDLYRTSIDMAEWAESHGGALIVLSEHHASPDGYLPSPIVLASAMAARTSTLHFLVAAAILPFYDPVRLAEDMAVLDHVSAGRVSYVLGLGYRPQEFEMYGVDFATRGARADRNLETLLRVRSGEVVEVDGRRVMVTPAPATPGGPAIAWGGHSAAAARRAARHGLDLLAQGDRDGLAAVYREECGRVGRPPGVCHVPDPSMPLTTFVADDLDAAWAELGPYLLHDARTYAGWNPGDRSTASLSRAGTIAALRAEHGSHRVFTVDEAADHVRQTGMLPLHPLCGGLPPNRAWPYLRRVAEDVLPRVTTG